MLSSKQKAYLKSLANQIKSVLQIGKDGLSDNILVNVESYLQKNELMKVSILQNATVDADEVIAFFENADIEVVEHIGRTLILYKHSDKAKNPIVLPVKQIKK